MPAAKVYNAGAGSRKRDSHGNDAFGKTGMKVSRLCLGCMTYGSTKWREWVLEEEASRPFFKEALERGINFFDTADVYSHRRQRGDRRPRAEGLRQAA